MADPNRLPYHLVVHPYRHNAVRFCLDRSLMPQQVIFIECRDDLDKIRGREFVRGFDEVHWLSSLHDISYDRLMGEIDLRFRR